MPEAAPIVTALIQGPDRRGIIAVLTNFIFQNNGNIVYLDQHTDTDEGMFFMRIQFSLEGFFIPGDNVAQALSKVCEGLGMTLHLTFSDRKKRAAILVSRQGHCLLDLLYRWKAGHLDMDIPLIVSNQPDQKDLAVYYEIPFHYLPVARESREEQEKKVIALLARERVDFVVLARYMQILSPAVVEAFPKRIINIHHSFLPAFVGANPYLQAFTRGVKVIGATSHYVTDVLDEGPIIAQDVIQVSHRDTVDDLKRKGQDIEKMVLARATALHAEDRVIVHNGKTIVFGD